MQRDDQRNDDQKNTEERRRMEPEQPKKPPKQKPEKTENVQPAIDAEGDDAASESADQTNLERRRDDPFATAQQTGEIARLLDNDPDAPREETEPFIGLPDITDPVVGLEALDDLEAQSSDAVATGDSPVSLSEAEVEKLVQQIVDEMAARQTSFDAASPGKLAGIVLRRVQGADSESEGTADAVAPDAQGQPLTPPRMHKTAPALGRFPGEGNLATPPRVVVMVQLADAQALMEEDRIALAPEMAAMVREIADARIESAENTKINQRRAADHRLRR